MITGEKLTFLTTSWDDGHPLDLRLAALLAQYGLPATFYIPRASPRPVMNQNQIRALSCSFEIGAHTLDHLYLDTASDAEAMAQLSGSRRWIEDVTAKSCRTFCFPGGKFRERQLPLVSAAGFLSARTAELLSLRHPAPHANLLLIPTTVQAFPHAPSAYLKNALRRGHATRLLRSGDLFHAHNWLALAKRLLSRALRNGGVFHLWGHSWEIEQQNHWQNLEDLFAVIQLHRSELRFFTNGDLCAAATCPTAPGALPGTTFCAREAK